MNMFSRIINRLKKIRQQKAIILMYHQVCERRNDPWELAVHPDNFHAQLEYLKKNFNVVSTSDLADGISSRKLKRSVAITFDDGFRDNYTNAAPLLDFHELPATFYMATSAMKQEYVYWWDALQDVIFHSEVLPEKLDIKINQTPVQFSFHSDRILSSKLINQIRAWNYNLTIPNERVALYMLLWYNIKPLTYSEQSRVLADIRAWAGHDHFISQQGVTMSVREMQTLGDNPLFTIGAHTVHHAMLSQQNRTDQAFEVKESKHQLEKWLGKTVDGFAYPYGNYNEVTQSILKEAGFSYAVSTEPKAVTTEDDPYALPRIQVKNWCVYEFAAKLNEMVDE